MTSKSKPGGSSSTTDNVFVVNEVGHIRGSTPPPYYTKKVAVADFREHGDCKDAHAFGDTRELPSADILHECTVAHGPGGILSPSRNELGNEIDGRGRIGGYGLCHVEKIMKEEHFKVVFYKFSCRLEVIGPLTINPHTYRGIDLVDGPPLLLQGKKGVPDPFTRLRMEGITNMMMARLPGLHMKIIRPQECSANQAVHPYRPKLRVWTLETNPGGFYDWVAYDLHWTRNKMGGRRGEYNNYSLFCDKGGDTADRDGQILLNAIRDVMMVPGYGVLWQHVVNLQNAKFRFVEGYYPSQLKMPFTVNQEIFILDDDHPMDGELEEKPARVSVWDWNLEDAIKVFNGSAARDNYQSLIPTPTSKDGTALSWAKIGILPLKKGCAIYGTSVTQRSGRTMQTTRVFSNKPVLDNVMTQAADWPDEDVASTTSHNSKTTPTTQPQGSSLSKNAQGSSLQTKPAAGGQERTTTTSTNARQTQPPAEGAAGSSRQPPQRTNVNQSMGSTSRTAQSASSARPSGAATPVKPPAPPPHVPSPQSTNIPKLEELPRADLLILLRKHRNNSPVNSNLGVSELQVLLAEQRKRTLAAQKDVEKEKKDAITARFERDSAATNLGQKTTEMINLRQVMASTDAGVTKLNRKIITLTEDKKDAEGQRDRARTTATEVKDTLSRLKTGHERLKEEHVAAQRKVDEVEEQLSVITSEEVGANDDKTANPASSGNLQHADIKALEQKLKVQKGDYNDSIRETRQKHTQALEEVRANHAQMLQQIDKKQQERAEGVKALIQRNETAQSDLTQKECDLVNQKALCESERTRADALKEQVDALTKGQQVDIATISTLQTEAARRTTELKTATDRIEEMGS